MKTYTRKDGTVYIYHKSSICFDCESPMCEFQLKLELFPGMEFDKWEPKQNKSQIMRPLYSIIKCPYYKGIKESERRVDITTDILYNDYRNKHIASIADRVEVDVIAEWFGMAVDVVEDIIYKYTTA